MDLGISGKRALVCASSKGLGLGCAEALASAGVNLIMNARSELDLMYSANRIIDTYGVEVETVVADITSDNERSAILNQIKNHLIIIVNLSLNINSKLFMFYRLITFKIS